MQFEKTNKTKVILLYCCGIKVDFVFFKVSSQLKILITKVIDFNQTCTVVRSGFQFLFLAHFMNSITCTSAQH